MVKANARTGNNAVAYEHSENNLLEFFSKAGSLFVNKETFYGNESSALELFKPAWRTDNYKSMQLAMWLRDCRGGAGNRSGFRTIINWLGDNYPDWVKVNISLIPQYGRWDDLFALYNTPCEEVALQFWAQSILSTNPSINGLASKWADRQDTKLRGYMKLSPKAFRKLVVNNTKVVETLMCSGKWTDINYNTVPSVASARYSTAFKKHDETRYNEWRKALADPEKIESGEVKVNAETLFPHDIIRMVKNNGELDKVNINSLAEAQLKAMPNYMEGTNYRPIIINDESGSMSGVNVSGSITAFDVALGLALYCSEKIGKDNPFYRKFIPFSDNSELVTWTNRSFVDAISDAKARGYCGSTNIHAAFDVLIQAGKFFGVTKNIMPNLIIICSDMQFDQGVSDFQTPVQECINNWKNAGFGDISLCYWNLAGYNNQPATFKDKNIGLVSGFSPSILKAILSGKNFTPMAILEDTISKYKVVDPT